MIEPEAIDVASITDATVAASVARRFALRCGCAERMASEIGIVARELATNIARHAGRGALHLSVVDDTLEVRAVDAGPGDPDGLFGRASPGVVDETGRPRAGLGAGLGAVQRLSDRVEATRANGGGLVVCARRCIG